MSGINDNSQASTYGIPATQTQSPSTTSVFDPSAVTQTTVGGSSSYDPFGFPVNLGSQEIYVGYLPGSSVQRSNRGRISDDTNGPGTTGTDVQNQTVTVDDLLKHFHDLATSDNPYSRQAWAQVQQQLQAMNAYGSSARINYGGFNMEDEKALKSAVEGYLGGVTTNGAPPTNMQTFEEYLTQQSAQGAANNLDANQPGGPGGAGKSASLRPLSNPAVVNQAGDQTAEGFLGRAMNPTEQAGLLADVHGQEDAALASGDVYLRSVTPQSVAREYILQNNLPEYAQHQAESYMNAFANMFLTGASQRANTSLGDAAVPSFAGAGK